MNNYVVDSRITCTGQKTIDVVCIDFFYYFFKFIYLFIIIIIFFY